MVRRKGKFHPGLGRERQLFGGVKFLAMLVSHIPRRQEVTRRSRGALSTSRRKHFGRVEQAAEAPPPALLSLQDEDRDLAKVSKRHRARTQSLRGVSGPDSASESGPPAATDRLTTSFLKYSTRKP